MWIAHYGFHFLASGLTLVPTLHRAAGRRGAGGRRAELESGAAGPGEWLIPFELFALEIGLLVSLVLLYFIARATFPTVAAGPARVRTLGPHGVLLAAAGAWIMTQPMAMRGMMMDMPGHFMPGHDLMDHGMHDMRTTADADITTAPPSHAPEETRPDG
jgi:hypothetical protein